MSTLKTKNLQHPSATEPAIVLNPDGTFTADIDDLNAEALHGGTFSLRNKLINGSFDIWQRGTTFSGSVYTADRWKINSAGGASNRVFGPDGVATYAIQVSESAAAIMQFIELPATGRAGEYQVGTTWTLSWYQSNTSTVALSLTFMDSASVSGGTNAMSFGTPVAVETVGSWTRYKATITITEAPVSTNTCIRLVIGASGTANTQYTGIQFEKGGLTVLEVRPKGFELSLCQRYYQKTNGNLQFFASNSSTTNKVLSFSRPVTMRVTPAESGTPNSSWTPSFTSATASLFRAQANSVGQAGTAYLSNHEADAEF